MKQEIEEIDYGDAVKIEGRSVYRVEVLGIHPSYRMLDPDNPKDREYDPYEGTDRVMLDRPYQVYVLSWPEAMKVVEEAVDTQEFLYAIRVYDTPLNVRITDSESFESMFGVSETSEMKVCVLNAKGEEVGISVNDGYHPSDIFEYFDPDDMILNLAVVYQLPESGRRHGRI